MARTWLITGCSTGFGRALAQVLLERGERVAATARRPESLAGLVRDHGGRAAAISLDVTCEDQISFALADAQARLGPIEVLVNNAGRGDMGTVEETPVATARALMEVHYFGVIAMIRAVVPAMRERGSGQIVNIGSVAGQIGFPGLGYYSASKFALAGLTESLAAELSLSGVKVTLAELGPFATDFVANMGFNPPAFPQYDMAQLSAQAGNAAWNSGDDARLGARALVAALEAPHPPVRLVLGGQGLETVKLHEARRAAERAAWLPATMLEQLA